MKKAFLTGITGQTASYLAEHLLVQGYEVHGLIRRTSQPLDQNIKHLAGKVTLHYGDMTDSGSIHKAIKAVRPDEIYNMAGMSQVRWSYEVPVSTMDINCMGFVRIIEAVRSLQLDCKIYQACSSEMFGKVREVPQKETTPFHPRSPYGVSKAAAYYMARVYREAYGMKIYCGFLFNHECISPNTPLILRQNGYLKIMRPIDLRKPRSKAGQKEHWVFDGLEIWDGKEFVLLNCMTATRRKKENDDYRCRITNTRNGIIETTNHHNLLNEFGKKIKAAETNIGDKLLHGEYPLSSNHTAISVEEAEFMGLMVADGWVSEDGGHAKFANKDEGVLKRVSELWGKVAMGVTSMPYSHKTNYGVGVFISLTGNNGYLKRLREQIYTFDKLKKIPDLILNATSEQKLAFLHGYNTGDGLKSNPCTYKYKNFSTNSPVLACGLVYLISTTTGQTFNVTFDEDEKYYGYYRINFHTPPHNKREEMEAALATGKSLRGLAKEYGFNRGSLSAIQKGEPIFQAQHHKKLDPKEIKKVVYHRDQPEWVFDLETSSGKFMCGVGTTVVANSPRRGIEFLSRKVCVAAAEIAMGKRDKLVLGNLDAKRDFGFASEYAVWIHRIMQHETPDDFVIATGETHSVKEFVELAFFHAGIHDWENYVEYDKDLTRPAEVDLLIGDFSKSKEVLGFEPTVKFTDLVFLMVDAEMRKLKHQQ